jgi:hypothetical protein
MASDTPQDLSAPIDTIADPKQVDATDGGWSVESHSKDAVTPPADTTEATAGDEFAESAPARTVTTSAPPAKASAAAPSSSAKSKKKQTFQERIDELTGKKGQAERELSAANGRVADLERRLANLETRPASAAQPAEQERPAARAAAPAAADPLALPDPPKYVDFDTDAAYTAAVAQWRTDTNAVLVAREAKIKADVSAEVDGRFAAKSVEEQSRAAEAQVLGRIGQIAVAHPDFPELMQANAQVFAAITREKAPFIHDIITNTADGGELFYDLAKDPEVALALAELPIPTRPLADAVRSSPAARALMNHFATDAGREDFLRLRQLHPVRVLAEVGKLEHVLETADSGSVKSAPRPITNAVPPARPPVGSPRARDPQAPGSSHTPFDQWMADEDARELAERRARVGASATA